MNYTYYILHKPYGMISQFSREGNHKTLADLNFKFQKDVYPVGRLDTDSEGLLILTNDKTLNHRLLDPKYKHSRSYLSQVEGDFNSAAKSTLEKGVLISVNGKSYKTLPCQVEIISNPNSLTERNPPIRFRKNIPTCWIKISLHEGKNRQVRKMTAAVGYPTLRLVRVAIEGVKLNNLPPGQVTEIEKSKLFSLLQIKL